LGDTWGVVNITYLHVPTSSIDMRGTSGLDPRREGLPWQEREAYAGHYLMDKREKKELIPTM
jgi:hypothetical protein